MDKEVAKQNAQAEERLRKLALPPLRAESKKALEDNVGRTIGRFAIIRQVAERHDVDPLELYTKYVVETRGEDDPENPKVSPKGASGPFQVMPKVRAEFEDKSIQDPFEREADLAARHIADFQKRNQFGSADARSVVYNYGEGNFRDWGGRASEPLNDQSTNYVAYSRYIKPALKKGIADLAARQGELRAGEQAMVSAASAPAPLEEMDIVDYYKRKLTGNLRTPEQYEAERAQFNQVTESARKAAAAAYRRESK